MTPSASVAAAPRVSVVVPTYNRAPVLGRLLDALAACRVPDGGLEVVVVDDGSTDGTADVIAASTLPGLVYEHQRNAGAAAARNRGWRRARGEIVAFTDDDCVPSQDWITDLVAAMDRERCDGAGGRIVPLVPGFVADFVQAERLVGHGGDRGAVKYLVTANAAFTRETLEAVDGFDERFPGAAGEDTDLTYRIQDQQRRLTITACGTVAHDHRTTWRGLFRTYYRHGRAWHVLAMAHPGRTGGTRSRILRPGYWGDRFRYYRAEGAGTVAALSFCALRVVGMTCFVIGMKLEARADRRRR
jgi:glycosyltransferase involved in cell wall biosynthesis